MDAMNIEVLEDGSLRIDTGPISAVNHTTAEAFLRNISQACGGKQERRHKHGVIGADVHAIQHTLGHEH
jgi:hypothetical protein